MFLSLKIALSSLAAHKLRAVLAMLGVFLGALALTGVQHMSLAMVRKAEIETEKFGPNLFAAMAGEVRFRRSGSLRISSDARTFRPGDAEALMRGLPNVLAGAPVVTAKISLRANGNKVPSQLVATVPAFTRVRNFRPDIGRFINDDDVEQRSKVIVLGRKIAERLFDRPELAEGRNVLFFRASFKVVGVMEAKGRDLAGDDQDEQVFLPITTYMRRAANQDWISGVYLQLAPGTDIDMIKDSAETILRKRHKIRGGQKDDFFLVTARETMQLQRQALDLVQTLGLISSSVSFAVGGLGILSIMILLVRARRMEIGIRRAMGAKKRDIVRQFLLEAALMSGLGGAGGVLASLALTAVVYQIGDFPFVFDPMLVFGALTGSAAIGIAAGAYPAWQASEIGILDVLRSQ